jgi:hypothetical protein
MGGPAVRPVVILADDDEAITSNLAPFLGRKAGVGRDTTFRSVKIKIFFYSERPWYTF